MKQTPMINIRTLNLTISILEAGLPVTIDNFLEPITTQATTPAGDELTPPAIGAYWAGQGGIYGGILQYPDGLHHTIFGAKDLGDLAWGERGTETGATHRVSGVLNTTTLRDTDGSFPAAEAASEYSADGHYDFYLPSIGELNHAIQNIPDAFDKGAWYWSSTQRSALTAFTMHFVDGHQNGGVKGDELRVRPVRRLVIQ